MPQGLTDFFTSTNILLLIVIAGLGVILYLAKRGIAQGGDGADSRMILYLLIPLILIAGLGVLEVANGTEKIEIQAIFLIVIGVTALIWLLFIVAAGYSHLQLTDVKQALGLPEGSIRAMIALMLLLVFIIFGIFVFNISATGNSAGPAPMTTEQLGQAKNLSFIAPIKDKDGNITGYNTWVRQEITEPAQRLATQLLTTVGTLVVAVAGFYFGSSSVSSAVAAVRSTSPQATIGTINPLEGQQNAQVSLVITGRNFQVPRAVRLARGNEEMLASDVMASGEKITGTVKLDKSAGGNNWDVVIQNADGTETRSEKVFKIT
jgi:heme/copper-type cytochrome/quinol oxidase subunit 2